MANDIQVIPNTTYVGTDILCTIDPENPVNGTLTIWRNTLTSRVAIRGAFEVPVVSSAFSITDIECPLDTEIIYEFFHSPATGGLDYDVASDPITLSDDPAMPKYALRSLFDPLGLYASGSELETPLGTDVGIGPLDDEEHKLRGGLFSVIGRPDPVLVFDTAESQSSMIPFFTYDAGTTLRVRRIIKSGDPLLFQTPDAFLLGDNGVVYCQPTTAIEKRIIPRATDPRRKFEISYVQIAKPDAATVLAPVGRTYAELLALYATYQDIINEVPNYTTLTWGDKWS